MIFRTGAWFCGLMGFSACLAEAVDDAGSKTTNVSWIAVAAVLLCVGAVAVLFMRRGRGGARGDRSKTHTPPQPVAVKPRMPQPIAADEEARLLKEIAEAGDRLGSLSDDMLKLYGGSSGIQRLRIKTKDDPQTPVKSAEAMLLESKTLQLEDAWREYKAIQARFADPAYDRPFRDPELEARRKALLQLIRAPHENRAAYDDLERQAQ